MMPLGRFGALLLGLALAVAWSSTASAARPKKSKKRGAPAASVEKDSSGSSYRAPSRHSSPRSAAPSPRASSKPSGGRSGASSEPNRHPAPSRAYSAPRSARPDRGAPSGDFRRSSPQRSAPGSRSLNHPGRGGFRTPSELPRTALPPVRKVAPTLVRGGQTYAQQLVVQGEGIVVRRSAAADHHYDGHYEGDSHHPHHGHHDHYYDHHYWGGGYYFCYVHYWFYEPWFWGFYFAPFLTPWTYTWVWFGAPWYVSWRWYYSPYAYYEGPSYWVTDYVIASMLEDEYARGYSDGYAAGQQQAATAGTPISEPVKEQLRQQVDATAQSFQVERSIRLEDALADPEHLFIVDTPISAASVGGGTCSLNGGDIIKAAGPADPDVPVASMTVVTSKSESCAAGTVVSVSFTDLQEMLNTFGERVDDGLNELQKQGQKQREGAE
ncbi:MAG: hypothetical protein M0R80_27185 [Proteobacteria bacterium]|nr:hypothetical protein [Pseudomonadota bacterium]